MVPKGNNWRPHEVVTVDVGDSAFRLALEVCAEAGAKHAEEVGRPDDAVIVEIRIARVPIVLDAAEAGVGPQRIRGDQHLRFGEGGKKGTSKSWQDPCEIDEFSRLLALGAHRYAAFLAAYPAS